MSPRSTGDGPTPRPTCPDCGMPLDDPALLIGAARCTVCALKGYLPEIGEEDPDALAWIKSVWHDIPPDAEFRRHGQKPVRLKQLIREEAEAIRRQKPFRDRILEAIEKATGMRYEPARTGAAASDQGFRPQLTHG